jgi:hypothetical protein
MFIGSVFFSNPSRAVGNETIVKESLSNGIQKAIKTLGPDHSFYYYDLQLSDHEIKILKSLRINTTKEYSNYGNLKDLSSEVRAFLRSLNKENEAIAEAAPQIIVRIVNDIVQASGQETAWVAVRSFIPTSEYDVPRWHQDGYYYAPYEGDPYKFAITLKGPATLFYKLPSDLKEKFLTLTREGNEKNGYNRQALATLLKPFKETISIPQPYQGPIFVVGSDNAAVHSEPSIHEERLFLSVLPGSKAQIKEWQEQ